MGKERILVTVKTYPNLSSKYIETVCTAGLRPDGTWVRIYPVRFRWLDEEQQYKKFDWIECEIRHASNDKRPESFRPVNPGELRAPVGHMGREHNWRERRQLILKKATVFDRLDVLIAGAKSNTMSLAVFKPAQILDFTWTPEKRDWPPGKLEQIALKLNQQDLFADNARREAFKVVDRLPYRFSYKFRDMAGRVSAPTILDWEIGALFWNCLRDANGDENVALRKVRQKYLDEFLKKDLHFFMGTTSRHHLRAPNPWLIVGVLPIPFENQMDLFE